MPAFCDRGGDCGPGIRDPNDNEPLLHNRLGQALQVPPLPATSHCPRATLLCFKLALRPQWGGRQAEADAQYLTAVQAGFWRDPLQRPVPNFRPEIQVPCPTGRADAAAVSSRCCCAPSRPCLQPELTVVLTATV